jgi:hypothetical protein
MPATAPDTAATPPALVFETAAEHLTARFPVVAPADRAGAGGRHHGVPPSVPNGTSRTRGMVRLVARG